MATAESSPRINGEGTPSAWTERFTDRQLRLGGLLIAAGAVAATLVMADSWPGSTIAQGPQPNVEQFDATPPPSVLGHPVAF